MRRTPRSASSRSTSRSKLAQDSWRSERVAGRDEAGDLLRGAYELGPELVEPRVGHAHGGRLDGDGGACVPRFVQDRRAHAADPGHRLLIVGTPAALANPAQVRAQAGG